MSSLNWMSALGDQSISVSPAISSSGDKAEGWSTVASESTCGATPSASLTGIGSDGTQMSDNLASVSSLMMPSDPSPTFTVSMVTSSSTPSAVATGLVNSVNRPIASPISVSASPSPSLQYPLSPLQSMSRSQQQPQQQQQSTLYRHHQRHHTVSTPIAIGQAAPCNTRSTRLNSISHPAPIHPHHGKRSKFSHYTLRKSGAENGTLKDGPRSASIGFVNFNPTIVRPVWRPAVAARRRRDARRKLRRSEGSLVRQQRRRFLRRVGFKDVGEGGFAGYRAWFVNREAKHPVILDIFMATLKSFQIRPQFDQGSWIGTYEFTPHLHSSRPCLGESCSMCTNKEGRDLS